MEFDKDLMARQEARQLCARAERAQQTLAAMSQQQLDRIVAHVARRFSAACVELAELAVAETGFGNVDDKVTKNRFACEKVQQAMENMQCVGILERDETQGLWTIGVPKGVIAAIVPSTNPTSTICYKTLIALKSGNAIVFSPHPKALACSLRAAKVVTEAALEAGAPAGSVSCLTLGAMAGTQELMAAPQVRLILATGGPGMVKAAYSSGKPAIGVGAGNGPAYIHRSANVEQALDCILRSKSFDNGTVCASEQSIIVERSMEQQVRQQAGKMGFYFLSREEAGRLAELLFRPDRSLNPAIVGKSALQLGQMAQINLPPDTKILVAREQEAGPTRPYSMEKLCPVLAFFVMDSEEAVLQKAVEVLRHEGSGHTFVLHAQDLSVVERFALQIPVSRFLVNTPAALGGIGATTALFPALTLGCGAVGGSSSSNNISPLDLIDLRRVAWGRTEETESGSLVQLITQQILQYLDRK